MGSLATPPVDLSNMEKNNVHQKEMEMKMEMERCSGGFRMPLHYPRYSKSEYEAMPEWKLDCLLKEYGLPVTGDVAEKRSLAIESFLWT